MRVISPQKSIYPQTYPSHGQMVEVTKVERGPKKLFIMIIVGTKSLTTPNKRYLGKNISQLYV
jgi:hypothetical protein